MDTTTLAQVLIRLDRVEHELHALMAQQPPHASWRAPRRLPAGIEEVLADEALTIGQITKRLNAHVNVEVEHVVGESSVRAEVLRMHDEGSLVRERADRGHVKRFTYRRLPGLTGAIADLDRRVRDN